MELVDTNSKLPEIGIIPDDWVVTEFGDIAERIIGGGTPSRSNPLFWGNEIPWVTVKDFATFNPFQTQEYITKEGLNNSASHLIPKGIIITSTRMALGKAVIYEVDVSINQDLKAIFPKNILDTKFLFYWFQYNSKLIEDLGSGSTVMGISLVDLRKIKFVLPTKPEQTAIAIALSDIDALIISLEKLIDKKRKIKQGVMQRLLKPKAGWVEHKLGSIAMIKARIGWQGLTTAEYRKSGNYFLITGTEFRNGYIDWEKCFYVDEERYKQDKFIQISEHDVLVTKDGTIGKVALIKSIPKPATLNSGVFVIRPKDKSFYPEFFYYILLSDIFKIFLSQLSASSTISHLYQKDFVTFRFLTPQTIEEQKNIANTLSNIDEEISLLETKLNKMKKIKFGMMQNLLTGKIRLVQKGELKEV